jgi:O-antigen/teichoic acid export membrane protein
MSRSAFSADGPTKDHRTRHRLLTLSGGRITRHTIIYAIGMLAVGPFSLVSVVVLTRLLVPSLYGQLGVLFVFAGFLTVLYNTGSLHGTFMWVYGISEGEGDDVGSQAEITSAPRRALGTGVVLTLMIVTAGTAVCFVLAPVISQLLLHHRSGAALVRWAAASAATGALWRLAVNVFRMERQPGRFAAFNATRPLFVVAGTVPLVALGFGVQGALAGTALGTLVATAVCIAMARRSYALAFCWSDVKKIVRLGSIVVTPVLCLFVVHSGDIVLLSRFASAHELGIYRVASRFAVAPSYFASSFLMAWAPLEHGVLFRATYRHVGQDRVRGALLTYYLLVATTIVVLLDVGANILVLLAGSQYGSAAPLIPLIGVAFVCYGLYIVLVRTGTMQRHMLWYSVGAVLAGVLQIGLSALTIPWLGAYGAPLATTLGLVVACLMWLVLVSRAEESFSFEARPLAGLAAAIVIAVAIQVIGLTLWPAGRAVVLALVLASYAIAIVALEVIPRRHFKPLLRLARAALRKGLGGMDPTMSLGRLDPGRRSLLASIERDGVPAVVLAERLRRSEREIECEYVTALRELIGVPGAPAEHEELYPRIAAYLLSQQPEAQRDLIAHELVEQGVDALELMELDEAARRLRALPRQAWTTSGAAEASERGLEVSLKAVAEHLAGLPPIQRRAAVALLRDGRTPQQVAAETGIPGQLVAARAVRVLRRVGGLGGGGPRDATIGMALFGSPSAEPRPPDSRAVALVYDRVRRYPRWRWRRALPADLEGIEDIGSSAARELPGADRSRPMPAEVALAGAGLEQAGAGQL